MFVCRGRSVFPHRYRRGLVLWFWLTGGRLFAAFDFLGDARGGHGWLWLALVLLFGGRLLPFVFGLG